MDIGKLEQKLQAKRTELMSQLGTLETETHPATESEVLDPMDVATAEQGESEAGEEASVMYQALREVDAALDRVKSGSYGTCEACRQPIAPARLDAIPWARYCARDQEKQETAAALPTGVSL
jgi:DnaK suppressor protein